MGVRKRALSKKDSFPAPVTAQVLQQRVVERETTGGKGRKRRQQNEEAPPPPGCLRKLQDPNPHFRELGCNDAATLFLDPNARQQLLEHRIPFILISLLSDTANHVKSSAAVALRNCFSVSPDALIDELAQPALLETIGAGLQTLLHSIRTFQPSAAPAPAAPAAGEEEEEDEVPHAPDNSLETLKSTLEEWLQLTAVLVETSEAAANMFSSSAPFLQLVVDCLAVQECAAPAAELLSVISSDNQQVANFLMLQLSEAQRNAMSAAVSTVPLSPSMLRISINLASTLLNCSPTLESIRMVTKVVVAALQNTPLTGIRQILPVLSENCAFDEVLRRSSIQQQQDRLKALQAAIDAVGSILTIATEGHPEELEDEEAFRLNPYAQEFFASGIPAAIAELAKEILPPVQDVVLAALIRAPSISVHVTAIQKLYLAVEVGVCGLVSNLLLLLPLNAMGSDVNGMWTTAVGALSERLQLLHHAKNHTSPHESDETEEQAILQGGSIFETPEAQEQLLYQIESIVEMLWTILRKDTQFTAVVAPSTIDVLSRLLWEPSASVETKVFILNTLGCIGTRSRNAESIFICGRLCTTVIQTEMENLQKLGNSATPEMVELAAESANIIMDMFADEQYDTSAYVPLGIHPTLQHLLPMLKYAVSRVRRKHLKHHLDEIATNVEGFLAYKVSNVPGLR